MKIQDRILLGALAGVLANIPKKLWNRGLGMNYLETEVDGTERAAGMLVPSHMVSKPEGQAVGWIADSVIAGMIGVVMSYALSMSGADKATLKGALTGQIAWSGLYGVLATMGATTVKSVSPRTVLSELVGHTLYGATTATLIVALGDPDLFNGKKPLFASCIKTNRT